MAGVLGAQGGTRGPGSGCTLTPSGPQAEIRHQNQKKVFKELAFQEAMRRQEAQPKERVIRLDERWRMPGPSEGLAPSPTLP